MSKKTNGTTVNNPEPLSRNDATRLHIGKDDSIDYLGYGKFQIRHLAIWTTMLSQANVRKVYRDFTKIAPSEKCNEIKDDPLVKDPCERLREPHKWKAFLREKMNKYICPNIIFDKACSQNISVIDTERNDSMQK